MNAITNCIIPSQLGTPLDQVPSSWHVINSSPLSLYPESQVNQHPIVYELFLQFEGVETPCFGVGTDGHDTAENKFHNYVNVCLEKLQ